MTSINISYIKTLSVADLIGTTQMTTGFGIVCVGDETECELAKLFLMRFRP
jgi:hypothetical protein